MLDDCRRRQARSNRRQEGIPLHRPILPPRRHIDHEGVPVLPVSRKASRSCRYSLLDSIGPCRRPVSRLMKPLPLSMGGWPESEASPSGETLLLPFVWSPPLANSPFLPTKERLAKPAAG